MATVKIDTDYVLISDADSLTGWSAIGGGKAILDTDLVLQGAACIGTEAKTTGIKGIRFDIGAGGSDLSGKHLMMWSFVIGAGFVSTLAQGGVFIRVEDTSGNTGDYFVGGSDVPWVGQGWKLIVVDIDRPFDRHSGTIPNRAAIRFVGLAGDFQTTVNKATALAIDITRYGTRFEVTGGASGVIDPISFDDIITKDQITDDTWFGIVNRDKNGNLELNGKIYIGDPSGTRNLTTSFIDTNEILVFTDNPVASGYYEIIGSQVAGASTEIRFGEAAGSGLATIGSKGLTITTDETINNIGLSGWLHKPNLKFLDNFDFLGIYSLNTSRMDEVNVGQVSGLILGNNIEIVDSNFNDINRFVRGIDTSSGTPLILRNKISFARNAVASIDLADSVGINSSEFDIVQGPGFINTPPGIVFLRDIDYNFQQFTTPYITVADDETWRAINPIWAIDTSTQNELSFVSSGNNKVEERFAVNVTTTDLVGSLLNDTQVFLYEGLTGQRIVEQDFIIENGFTALDVLKRVFKPSGTALSSTQQGNFALRVYKYNFEPFILPITVEQEVDRSITLGPDTAIVETDQNTAISGALSVIPTSHGTSEDADPNPIKVIHFDGGTGSPVPQVGDIITGVNAGVNASGTVVEVLGDVTEGTLVMQLWNGTNFDNNAALSSDGVGSTWAALADITGGSQSFQEEFRWLIDGNTRNMTVIYDKLMAEMSQQISPNVLILPSGGQFKNQSDFAGSYEEGDIFNIIETTPIAGDSFYCGTFRTFFEDLRFDINVPGSGNTFRWDYWNGSSWHPLSGVVDETNNFSASGELSLFWDFPVDWQQNSVGGISGFWVRSFLESAGSGPVTLNHIDVDHVYEEVAEWSRGNVSKLLFLGNNGYFTLRSGTEGVWVANRGAGNIDFFTSNGGNTFTPPQQFNLTLTGLKSNSEVKIYQNVGGKAIGDPLGGTENSGTSFNYSYIYSGADIDVVVVIFHLLWKDIRLFLTLSNNDQSIPIQQVIDRVYNNP